MTTVAVAALNGTTEFELSIPLEVFGVDRRSLTPDWYDFKLCLAEPPPVRTEMGLIVDSPYGLEDLAAADTIIVPAAAGAALREPLFEVLHDAERRGARIVSLCTGAFLLAEAGLLNGRCATTHWAHTEEFARRYPEVEIDCDVLYVQDGQVFTAAGAAAAIDLCLHLVRLDLGTDVANAIARRLVVPPHRDGGQTQYVATPLAPCTEPGIAGLLDWALERLHEPLTIEDLARHAAVSPRTLVRRFAATTGTTPLQWLLQQRVRRAQLLLESSDESIERVAELAGLGTSANLRQHFARAVGVSPMAYRRTFRGVGHHAAAAAEVAAG